MEDSNLLEVLWTHEFQPDYSPQDEEKFVALEESELVNVTTNELVPVSSGWKRLFCSKSKKEVDRIISIPIDETLFEASQFCVSPNGKLVCVIVCQSRLVHTTVQESRDDYLYVVKDSNCTKVLLESVCGISLFDNYCQDELGRLRKICWNESSNLFAVSSPSNRKIFIFSANGELLHVVKLYKKLLPYSFEHNWIMDLVFGEKRDDHHDLFITDEFNLYRMIVSENTEPPRYPTIISEGLNSPSSVRNRRTRSFESFLASDKPAFDDFSVSLLDDLFVANSVIYRKPYVIVCGPASISSVSSDNFFRLSIWEPIDSDPYFQWVACTSPKIVIKKENFSTRFFDMFKSTSNVLSKESHVYGTRCILSPNKHWMLCLRALSLYETTNWQCVFSNTLNDFSQIETFIPRNSQKLQSSLNLNVSINNQGQWVSEAIADISWWSNECLMVSLREGNVFMIYLEELLKKIPVNRWNRFHLGSKLSGVPLLSNAFPIDQRCYSLECQYYYLRNRRDWSEPPALLEFGFTIRRVYRLLSVCKTPPKECFFRLLVNKSYDHALNISRIFSLDTDPLYQARWNEEGSTWNKMWLYLDQIKDSWWVLEELSKCKINRRFITTDRFNEIESDLAVKQRLIFAYGLYKTRKSPLNFNSEIFMSIRCPEIENIDDSEDSNYIKALIYRIAKFDDQKCIDYLNGIILPNFIDDFETFNDLRAGIFRLFFLNGLYRLKSYCLIYNPNGGSKEDSWFNSFFKFHKNSIVFLASEFACDENFSALDVLFRRHLNDLTEANVLDILDKIPVTTSPFKYKKFLPLSINSSWPESLRFDYTSISSDELSQNKADSTITLRSSKAWNTVQNWNDWKWDVVEIHSLIAIPFRSFRSTVDSFRVYFPNTYVSLEEKSRWYSERVRKIESESGQLDHALTLCEFGCDFIPSELSLLVKQLNHLVYELGYKNLDLISWENTSIIDRLSFILKDSSKDSLLLDLKHASDLIKLDPSLSVRKNGEYLNLLTMCQSGVFDINTCLDSWSTHGQFFRFLGSFLLSRSSINSDNDGLELLAPILLAFKKGSFNLVSNPLLIIEISLAVVYNAGTLNFSRVKLVQEIYESLPDIDVAYEHSDMIEVALDETRKQLKACILSAKYNCNKSLGFFGNINIQNSMFIENWLTTLLKQLVIKDASDKEWTEFLNDVLNLPISICLENIRVWFLTSYFRGLLDSCKISLCRRMISEFEAEKISNEVVENLVISAAVLKFSSATEIDHPSFRDAERLLLDVLPLTPNIQVELNLIEGLKILKELLSKWKVFQRVLPSDFRGDSKIKIKSLNSVLNLLKQSEIAEKILSNPEEILQVANKLGLSNFEQQMEVQMILANLAFTSGNTIFLLQLLMDLISKDYKPCWKICAEVSMAERSDIDPSMKKQLLLHCIANCPATDLERFVLFWKKSCFDEIVRPKDLTISLVKLEEIALANLNASSWTSSEIDNFSVPLISKNLWNNRSKLVYSRSKFAVSNVLSCRFDSVFDDISISIVEVLWKKDLLRVESFLFAISNQSFALKYLLKFTLNNESFVSAENFKKLKFVELCFRFSCITILSRSCSKLDLIDLLDCSYDMIEEKIAPLLVNILFDELRLNELSATDVVLKLEDMLLIVYHFKLLLLKYGRISELLKSVPNIVESEYLSISEYRKLKLFELVSDCDPKNLGIALELLELGPVDHDVSSLTLYMQFIKSALCTLDSSQFKAAKNAILSFEKELLKSPVEFDLELQQIYAKLGMDLERLHYWFSLRLDCANVLIQNSSILNSNNTQSFPWITPNSISLQCSLNDLNFHVEFLSENIALITRLISFNILVDYKALLSTSAITYESMNSVVIALSECLTQSNILTFSRIAGKLSHLREIVGAPSCISIDAALLNFVFLATNLFSLRNNIDMSLLSNLSPCFMKLNINMLSELALSFCTGSCWYESLYLHKYKHSNKSTCPSLNSRILLLKYVLGLCVEKFANSKDYSYFMKHLIQAGEILNFLREFHSKIIELSKDFRSPQIQVLIELVEFCPVNWKFIRVSLLCLLYESFPFENLTSDLDVLLSYKVDMKSRIILLDNLIAKLPVDSIVASKCSELGVCFDLNIYDASQQSSLRFYYNSLNYVSHVLDFGELSKEMLLNQLMDCSMSNICTYFRSLESDLQQLYVCNLNGTACFPSFAMLPTLDSSNLYCFSFDKNNNHNVAELYLLVFNFTNSFSVESGLEFYLSEWEHVSLSTTSLPLWNISLMPPNVFWNCRVVFSLLGLTHLWKLASSSFEFEMVHDLVSQYLFSCIECDDILILNHYNHNRIKLLAKLLLGTFILPCSNLEEFYVLVLSKLNSVLCTNGEHQLCSIGSLLWQCQDFGWFGKMVTEKKVSKEAQKNSGIQTKSVVKSSSNKSTGWDDDEFFDDFFVENKPSTIEPDVINIDDAWEVEFDVKSSHSTNSVEINLAPPWLVPLWINVLECYLEGIKSKFYSESRLVILFSRALKILPFDLQLDFFNRLKSEILSFKIGALIILHSETPDLFKETLVKRLKVFAESYNAIGVAKSESRVDCMKDSQFLDILLCSELYSQFCNSVPVVSPFHLSILLYFESINSVTKPFFKAHRNILQFTQKFLGSSLHSICVLISDGHIKHALDIFSKLNKSKADKPSLCSYLKKELDLLPVSELESYKCHVLHDAIELLQ